MEWKELGNVLAKAAPALATALGGPLAGGAVAALEGVFGITEGGSAKERTEALVAAISGATPDQMLALKKADQDFAVRMEELGIKREETANADRDSARKRESDVKDKTPRNLAYAITAGYFGMLIFMMLYPIPAASRDILNYMLGTLGTAWIAAVTYYFGSTNGSFEKSRLLAQVPEKKEEKK
jgi:hypothetical protein